MRKFSHKTTVGFALGALLLSGLAISPRLINAAPGKPINPPCERLAGTFVFTVFQFTGPTTAIGRGIVYDGEVPVGTFDADYFNIEAHGKPGRANGVIQMNARHVVTFADGNSFTTRDEILLEPVKTNPGWMRANSRLYIVGGTGAYADATGLLHTHGLANVFTVPPQGSIGFEGQICVP